MRPRHRAVILGLILPIALPGCEGASHDGRTEEEWVTIVRTGSGPDRIRAAAALGQMKARAPVTRSALVAGLADTSMAVAVWSARAMKHLEDASRHRERILLLLWRAVGDTAFDGREAALEALGMEPFHDPRSVALLVAALADPAVSMRATAASALSHLGSVAAPALDALHTALRDTNEMVRHEARHSIREISGEVLRH